MNFEAAKIENAIFKALEATKTGDRPLAAELTQRVVNILNQRFSRSVSGVENIQDIVEEVLMGQGYLAAAKACILYREQRADVRR